MPLAPAPYDPRAVHSVHDGVMFAQEFARREPRTPECNILLLRRETRLGTVWPVYVSPTCSYAQVCSDAGITARGWMQRRARAFHEREEARQQVTPNTAAVKHHPGVGVGDARGVRQWKAARHVVCTPPSKPMIPATRKHLNGDS